MSDVKALIRGTGAATAPPAILPAEGEMDVGQRVEFDVVDGTDLAPLGQPSLGEEHVGQERRLAIARAIADEDGRTTTPPGVFDRRLLARSTTGARAAAVEVREVEGAGGPVDGVGEHGHLQAAADLVGVEAEAVGHHHDLGAPGPT